MLEQNPRVLIIGLSPLARLIASRYPAVRMSTVGPPDARFHQPDEWRHYDCDLTDPAFPWDALGRHDLVIAGGVLEFLPTPPGRLLLCAAQVLAPKGVLVLQTVNAAALGKRLRLLFGGNPRDPGHLREFTLSELRRLASENGFKVIEATVENSGASSRLLDPFLWPTLRDTINLLLSRR